MHAVVPLVFPAGGARCSALVLARPRPRHRAGAPRDHRRHAVRLRGADARLRLAGAAAAVLAAAHGRSPAATGWGASPPGSAGACADPNGTGFQTCHGLYALADGGWWGVGLGRQPGEVAVAARGAQRLHLRDHRRGARAARDVRGHGPLRGPRVGLLPARQRAPTTSSSASPAPASWSGSSVQAIINIGAVIGAPAGHRGAAAAGVGRRLGAGHHAVRASACCSPSPATSPAARGAVDAASGVRPRSLAVLPARRRTEPWMSAGTALLGPAGRRRLGRARVTAARPGRLPAPARPRRADHRARHRDRARAAAGARPAATDLRTIPKVPFPRRPTTDLLRLPGRAARRRRRGRRGHRRGRRRGRRRLRRLRLDARPTSPPGAARIPIVVHEQNARPGLANRLGARMTPLRRHDVRLDGAARTPGASACRCAARSPSSTGPRARDEALAHFGLEPTRGPPLLVTGGSLGAQRLNAAFAERVAALRAAGVQVLHVTGLGKEFDPGAADGPARPTSSSRTPTAWSSRTPPPTSWSRRVRRQHGLRADRGRAAGRLRPAADRQRRAAAQRRPTSSRPVGDSSSTTATFTPGVGRRRAAALCSADATRLAAMAAAAAGVGRARAPTSGWPTWSRLPAAPGRGGPQ